MTAAAVAVLLLTLIGLAYVSRGKAAGYIGGLGVSAVILSCVGIDLGIRGFREREKNYRTCKFGIGFSIFFLVSLILFFVGGFM